MVIIGVDGLLGQALWHTAQRRGGPCWGSSRRPAHTQHTDLSPCDLRRPQDFAQLPWHTWQAARHLLIPAALTGLRACQEQPERSAEVNVKGPLELAKRALAHGLQPVFFSSDQVFDGRTGCYGEDGPLNPLNVYGEHKAQLEQEARALSDRALILRLVKIYPGASALLPTDFQGRQTGLLNEMLGRLRAGQPLLAARDQIFNPLYLDDAVHGIEALLDAQHCGLINVAGDETLSRLDLAQRAAQQLAQASGHSLSELQTQIQAIDLAELPGALPRPLNVSLNNTRFRSLIGFPLQSVDDSLRELLPGG